MSQTLQKNPLPPLSIGNSNITGPLLGCISFYQWANFDLLKTVVVVGWSTAHSTPFVPSWCNLIIGILSFDPMVASSSEHDVMRFQV